ncbi:MAG: TIGR03617 family F420-dependent LLM class oxidoreductase [Acidimicrobiia bacterium]|nr:TIGR03617 family F420-dependent LLM class oxidoreductase [Acidimicrobiia bacterium]MDH3397305.1 TIGR03617 family F420-dependent LLM class oxidoreductase [Acidimicrobiia bacterium]
MRVDYYLPPIGLQAAADHAGRASNLGYDGFFTAETNHDPFLPLGVAAAVAPDLELGTGIAVAFGRSPMVVAHTAWDLAAASRGKFILGLGSQVRAHLTRRYSTPWVAPVPRLREYVRALHAIWSAWQEGGPLRFEGEHYRFSLMLPFFDPGPIDHPAVPVFTAAVGPAMTRLAGEVCDGIHVHPFHTVRYFDEVTLPALQEGASAAGRELSDVAVAASVFVAIGRTEEEIGSAREAVRKQIAFYASTPTYRPILDLHGWEIGPKLSALARRSDWDAMTGLIDDRILDEVAVTGSPEAIGRLLRERYGSRLQRVAFYGAGPGVTVGLDDDDWRAITEAIHS